MGVRLPSAATAPQQGNVSVVTTAETIIATLPPINISLDFAQILLFWWFTFTSGTATTGVSVKLRRGATVAGAVINVITAASTVTAGNQIQLSGCYADVPGAIANQQYVLTIAQTAATGNGSAQDPVLMAIML